MQSFLIGLVAGGFGGLVGLGGGVIVIPLLAGIMRIPQHKAHGTSLVAIVFTGIAGSVVYYMKGSVDPRSSILLALTAVLTAPAGAKYAHALSEWKLKRFFGAFLCLVSLLLMFKPHIPGLLSSTFMPYRNVVFLAAGILSGFISGLMGVGGGTIMVPAMVLFAGMGQHISQGTSLLAMVPAGVAGALTHWRLRNVDFRLLPGLVPGILTGTYIGGIAAHALSETVLAMVFSLILLWIGIRDIRTKRLNYIN